MIGLHQPRVEFAFQKVHEVLVPDLFLVVEVKRELSRGQQRLLASQWATQWALFSLWTQTLEQRLLH